MAKKKFLNNLSPEAIKKFTIEEYCFPEQVAFINDPNNFTTAVCSRRAGKTVACASDLVNTALTRPGTISLYITLSRASAKRIVWPEILELNRRYQRGGITNIADLSLTFPNGSVIYL